MWILITIGIVITVVLFVYGILTFEEKRLTREKKRHWFDSAEKFVKSIPLMNSSNLILLDKVADKMIELTDPNKFTLKPYDYYRESRFGGNIVIDKAKKILKNEFKELSEKIEIHIPDEKSRRVGQSVAAASLPELSE